ncbi:MAG: signal peptidase II [bacterium]
MGAALRRSFVWTTIGSLFIDQLTKIIVYGITGGIEGSPPISLIGNILKISYTTNTHGVFGIPFGPRIMYYILPGIGTILILGLALKTRSIWLGSAYGLILGGAAGNLIDRFRLGFVIDFIDFEIRTIRLRWFTFNLADAFVVVGVIMIFLYEIAGGVKRRRQQRKEVQEHEKACLSGQQLNNTD